MLNRLTSAQFSHDADIDLRPSDDTQSRDTLATSGGVPGTDGALGTAGGSPGAIGGTLGNTGGALSTTVEGLEALTDYEVCVQAYNAQGYGPLSTSARVTTKEDG